MKFLVTGATGFVGGHLIKALQQQGHTVRAFVRRGTGHRLAGREIEIAEGDITDVAAIRDAVKGCQSVFHLAAKMVGSNATRRDSHTVNVEGTRAVTEACRGQAVRLVHGSTVGVYGMIKTFPVDEESPVSPTSTYRATKYAAEQIVRRAVEQESLDAVIVRLPALIGPGSTLWLGLARAIRAGNFRIIGDGSNHDHITFISDAVAGLILCATTEGIGGETFILASDEAVTVNQIVDTLARELGVVGSRGNLPRFPFAFYSGLSTALYRAFGVELPGAYRYALFLNQKMFSIAKARDLLGYQPRVDFDRGIAETLAWYRQEGLL